MLCDCLGKAIDCAWCDGTGSVDCSAGMDRDMTAARSRAPEYVRAVPSALVPFYRARGWRTGWHDVYGEWMVWEKGGKPDDWRPKE